MMKAVLAAGPGSGDEVVEDSLAQTEPSFPNAQTWTDFKIGLRFQALAACQVTGAWWYRYADLTGEDPAPVLYVGPNEQWAEGVQVALAAEGWAEDGWERIDFVEPHALAANDEATLWVYTPSQRRLAREDGHWPAPEVSAPAGLVTTLTLPGRYDVPNWNPANVVPFGESNASYFLYPIVRPV